MGVPQGSILVHYLHKLHRQIVVKSLIMPTLLLDSGSCSQSKFKIQFFNECADACQIVCFKGSMQRHFTLSFVMLGDITTPLHWQ